MPDGPPAWGATGDDRLGQVPAGRGVNFTVGAPARPASTGCLAWAWLPVLRRPVPDHRLRRQPHLLPRRLQVAPPLPALAPHIGSGLGRRGRSAVPGGVPVPDGQATRSQRPPLRTAVIWSRPCLRRAWPGRLRRGHV